MMTKKRLIQAEFNDAMNDKVIWFVADIADEGLIGLADGMCKMKNLERITYYDKGEVQFDELPYGIRQDILQYFNDGILHLYVVYTGGEFKLAEPIELRMDYDYDFFIVGLYNAEDFVYD